MSGKNIKKILFNSVRRTLMSPFNTYRLSVKKSSCITDQKGQAVVEYLLITFVTTTLVLGLATKLVPQINTFVQNYAGAYVQCLLETGELPGSSFTTNPNSECTIEGMTASGRIQAPANSTLSGGGSGSGRGNASNSSQNGSSQGSGSGSSGSGGSGNSNNSPQPSYPGSSGADSIAGSASRSGNKSNSETASGAGSEKANNNNGSSSIRNPYANMQDNGRGISGAIAAPVTGTRSLNDKNENLRTGLKKDTTLGGEHLRKGSFSSKVNKAEGADADALQTEGLGFSFGLYLRYFLIGGILLALFIMVGTQLNSLRKSWGTA